MVYHAIQKWIILLVIFFTGQFTYSQSENAAKLIQAYNDSTDSRIKFDLLLDIGQFYKKNDVEKADSIRHIILKQSRYFNDSVRFEALYFNAEVTDITGNQREYFKIVLECQPFLNKLPSSDVIYRIYSHLGRYHSHHQEHETARFYFNSCIKSAKKNNGRNKLSESYSLLALDFMSSNQKDSSLYYVDKAISSARRLRDKSVLAKAFNVQAKIYNFFGQIELSVAKNLICLQLVEGTGDFHLLAKYTREIGQDQQLILNLNDAQYYFRRSLNYGKRINDKRQIALTLTNLASVQLEKGEYKTAIKNANEALIYLEKLSDNNGLGETYNILGKVYKQQGNYNDASSHLNQALVFYESAGNREEIAGVYHNVGTVFKEQKKYKNALNYLNRSIEIRENFGAKNQIYHTYRVIADVYKDINNKNKSLEYLELYLDYVDSNTILQSATKIAELSESYRSEQRERLISSQADSLARQQQERVITSTKLENSQLRLNFQMYIITAFLIIVLLGGIILFYRWNQTKIKQEHFEVEMSQTLLRTQMNPHFVFNAMSVIQSYIYDNDTVNSSKFLVNFSRLMRLILENSPKKYIPIGTEVEILEKYLGMQKLRFQDRFNFEIITEDILFEEHAFIPPMITQPFIENAIEHGQLHTIKNGFIHVSFKKKNDMLVISIVDNGVGRKGSKANKKSSEHKSMAIDITSQRIEHLNKKHNTDGSLLVEDFNKELQNGTNVLISLPYTFDKTISN